MVSECDDSWLSDVLSFPLSDDDVAAALSDAASGPVAEGCVGAGTGMACFDFKGGIGTASRRLPADAGGFTVGVLVLTNYGDRELLQIDGVHVGEAITDLMPTHHQDGSCVVVVATDAPLLPHQLRRVAQRGGMGLAATGSYASNGSGEQMIAFSTANRLSYGGASTDVRAVADGPGEEPWLLSRVFEATVEATQEAVVNALLAAETTTGKDGWTLYAMPVERTLELMACRRPLAPLSVSGSLPGHASKRSGSKGAGSNGGASPASGRPPAGPCRSPGSRPRSRGRSRPSKPSRTRRRTAARRARAVAGPTRTTAASRVRAPARSSIAAASRRGIDVGLRRFGREPRLTGRPHQHGPAVSMGVHDRADGAVRESRRSRPRWPSVGRFGLVLANAACWPGDSIRWVSRSGSGSQARDPAPRTRRSADGRRRVRAAPGSTGPPATIVVSASMIPSSVTTPRTVSSRIASPRACRWCRIEAPRSAAASAIATVRAPGSMRWPW